VEAGLIAAVERLTAAGTPFSEISIARLVTEAGIGRATFYLYFPDRASFVMRLADHARDLIAEPLGTLWGNLGVGRTALETALRDIVRRYREHRSIISAVIDAAGTDPAIAARLAEGMQLFIAASTAALEAGQRAGSVRAELPCAEAAAALSWMVERTCYQVARDADDAQLDQLALALTSICWYALHP
jgi:TetR/AcrR family transcriptional regulator, ethionamide resistance regulator